MRRNGGAAMKSLDHLLDDLAQYVTTPEESCWSLPRDAYLSPDLHDLEVREIFEKSWLCVGREEYVANPGDYFTLDLMDEPIVIVRGTDGEIRALNSACRHRYMPVVAGKGNAKRFVCPYHTWTYATDGRLIGAPHMEGSKVFDKAACSLPQYRLESWQGFLFVNLDDDAAPLQVSMASMDKAATNYRVHEQTEVFHYEMTWNGNWKLSAENSMEYYHHIGLHSGTVGVQMPAKGAYFPDSTQADETFTHSRCRVGDEFLGGADHPLNPRGDLTGLTQEELETGYLVYVYPAFTMAMRAGTNNWLAFRPDGPEKTKVLGGYLMWRDLVEEDPEITSARAELIEKVNTEDALATTELARVMRSRKADRGPLAPFEKTIAQFYKYLGRTLAGDRVTRQEAAE
jgi:phenylpropionate dioxygenase-like ring-hydroxylating dioxygenase large terminal subunit